MLKKVIEFPLRALKSLPCYFWYFTFTPKTPWIAGSSTNLAKSVTWPGSEHGFLCQLPQVGLLSAVGSLPAVRRGNHFLLPEGDHFLLSEGESLLSHIHSLARIWKLKRTMAFWPVINFSRVGILFFHSANISTYTVSNTLRCCRYTDIPENKTIFEGFMADGRKQNTWITS